MRIGMLSVFSALPATSLSKKNTHRDTAQLIKPTAADTSPLSFPDVKIGTANRPIPFLDRAGMLLKPDGQQRFNDSALAALALLVAESDPAQKDLMVRLIMSMLEDGAG